MNTQRTTFSVLYYIKRTRKLQNGEAPIFVRITWNGTRAEFGVQRSIPSEKWFDKAGKVLGKDKASTDHQYLDQYKARIYRAQAELMAEGTKIDAAGIKNRVFGLDRVRHFTLAEYDLHNEKLAKGIGITNSETTVIRHRTTRSHAAVFIKKAYGKEDLPIEEINHQFVLDFESYLRITRKCNNNSAVKYLKNFKKIINLAFNNGCITKYPFLGSRYRIEPVEKPYLTLPEIERLRALNLGIPRVDIVRDIFLFCCFTGLAFVDVKNLRSEHIKADPTGRLWIEKARQKTNVKSTVPILPPAGEIIVKYNNSSLLTDSGLILPVPSNQKMNAYLKELADLAGIDKVLTTHIARHTFATLALSFGIPIEVVSKMIGHSSIKLTQLYAKVDRELIGRNMDKIMLP